jgi:ABC-2 type transport system permease protein
MGKVLAYMFIALLEWLLSLILAYFMFGLSMQGDPTPFLVCTVIYLFTNVAFGTMVGVAIPNQAAAIQAVQIVGFLLSYLLSGAIFPVANIPFPLSLLSNIIPARYYIVVVRDALVRGGSWESVWYVPIGLAAIGLFFFSVAWLKMRKMQVAA